MTLTAEFQELSRRLKAGSHDPADLKYLEAVKADELVAELATAYPITFQKRRLKVKWELGLARKVEYRLAARPIRGTSFMAFHPRPILMNCLFLAGEGESVTSISVVRRIEVRPSRKPSPGAVLAATRGYKLARFPDGWQAQALPARTTRFSEDFLRQRGWQFDQLHPVSVTPPSMS